MSSYANGCMLVVLPEKNIGEFERFFNQGNENSFLNTEITLTNSENTGRTGYQKRIYDISCNTSLEACLNELLEKVSGSKNHEEALEYIGKYVDLVDVQKAKEIWGWNRGRKIEAESSDGMQWNRCTGKSIDYA